MAVRKPQGGWGGGVSCDNAPQNQQLLSSAEQKKKNLQSESRSEGAKRAPPEGGSRGSWIHKRGEEEFEIRREESERRTFLRQLFVGVRI